MHQDTRQTSIPMLFLGMALIAIGLAGSCSASANDRHPVIPEGVDREVVRDQLRVCFSERDISYHLADCLAIMEVTRNRSRMSGRTYLEQLRAYSSEATGQVRSSNPRQWWIASMEITCDEPTGWSAYNDWRVADGVCLRQAEDGDGLYRDEHGNTERVPCLRLPWEGQRRNACVATVNEIVEELQRPVPRAICRGGVVEHWGGRCDPDGSGRPARNPEGRRVGVCDRPPASWIRLDCSIDNRVTRNDYFAVPRARRRAPRASGAQPGVLPARVARGDQ